jgi:VWFA-related protein
MVRLLLSASLALSLAVISLTSAGGQEAIELRIDAVDTGGLPDITAVVTVLDALGRPVVGLPPQAFAASVGSQILPISGVDGSSDERLGIAVGLTFDTSGSMQGAALEQAKEAGKTLVRELGPNDQVAVLAFSNDVRVVQPFTQDRPALTEAIDGLVAAGNTALYDGVVRSIEVVKSSTLPRRAVVLLSDGVDFGGVSQNDRAGSISAGQSSGTSIFLVGLGASVDQPYLQELANAARGQVFLAPEPEALRTLYETIGSILRHQYVLSIDGGAIPREGSPSLRIQVNHAGAVASAEIPLNLSSLPPTPTPSDGTPAITPVPTPTSVTTEDGSSGLILVLAGLAVAAGLGAIGAMIALQRRGRRARWPSADVPREPSGAGAPKPIFAAAGPVTDAPALDAWLQLAAPSSGEPYPLGDSPIEIGFTTDCDICLPAGATHHWERVRVWRREGRYMLHNLSRMGSVTVAGRPAIWVVLEDGDEIQLGSCRLLFRESNQPVNG